MSSVYQCTQSNIPSQSQLTGVLQADSAVVGASDNNINSMDYCFEPTPHTSHCLPQNTTPGEQSGLMSSQQLDSNTGNVNSSALDRSMTYDEVMCRFVDGKQASNEVVSQQHLCINGDTVTSDQQASLTNNDPSSNQNPAPCRDWQFFAARRVDVPLLLDILLARKHRDRSARDFLLSLPASDLKKYEVFSRQNPIFVCLDIVN